MMPVDAFVRRLINRSGVVAVSEEDEQMIAYRVEYKRKLAEAAIEFEKYENVVTSDDLMDLI